MRVCVLSVYMGPLPRYFYHWQRTAKFNKNYDFYIITDNVTERVVEDNITFIPCTLNEYKQKVEALLGDTYSDLTQNNIKKIADSKIIYGHLFEDIINNYDWYGWTDLDTFYGDFDKYITEDVLNNYDCIGYISHKNKTIFGPFFLIKTKYKCLYKEIPNYQKFITKTFIKYCGSRRGASLVDEKEFCETLIDKKLKMYSSFCVNKRNVPIIRVSYPRLPAKWENGKIYIPKDATRSEEYYNEVGLETMVTHVGDDEINAIVEIENGFEIQPHNLIIAVPPQV
jgi:hypothetical protein